MSREIPLTRGYVAIVDDEDYEWLSQYNWCVLAINGQQPYAIRAGQRNGNRRQPHIRMHREIAGTPKGMDTDHANGNTLDNRRANLRACIRAENQRNQSKRKNCSSTYKGVSWNKRDGKWMAFVTVPAIAGGFSKSRNLGRFASEVEAAIAYDRAAIAYYGEFARTNAMLGLLPVKNDNTESSRNNCAA